MAELRSPNWMPQLISFLSSILERISESNDLNSRLSQQRISVFHGLTRPNISIQSYLQRIFKYANCSPTCYIVAYVYLDRFSQRQPLFPINSFNVHRLLITSVMVAAKFMDDMCYNNAYYARVGGVSTEEMNFMEVDFLFGLSFHLDVTPTTFHTYCSHLHTQMLIARNSPSLSLDLHHSTSSSSLAADDGSSTKLNLCQSEDDPSHHHHHRHQEQQLAA